MQNAGLKVVVARDRRSAGGGIFNYYQSIAKYLSVYVKFADVGKPFSFYSTKEFSLLRVASLRLLLDWGFYLFNIIVFRPRLVHLNPGLDIATFRSLRRDAVSLALAKLFRRKVLVFWRGWDNTACGSAEFPGGNNGWLSRVYRLADAHVVLAEQFKTDLYRWGFSAPVFVETTVVSDDVLAASPSGRVLSGKPLKLLFLSRIEIAKGVFELLDALFLLNQSAPGSFELTVAGDGPALKELQRRAGELRLPNVFFTGYLSGQAKVDAYRAADVFCFLSYTEGMPNAVLEAMAMGLPLVSSAAGGLKGILQGGVTGLIAEYSPDSPPRARFKPLEVANHLQALANDPSLYSRISVHNRHLAHERFAAPAVAARLQSIYQRVISGQDDQMQSDLTGLAAPTDR
jgi:glycosyltransferase involved in cell wall biosynthesis